ncbi:calcium-activated chloride channel-domain-containing protein [Astrocystis sublimbata]|nr:calcium-activated chloride channel-domain-containing protein [Astrocystis sublimbata]
MSTLHELTTADGADLAELKSNMNVDYVISYHISADKAEAEAGFIQLIEVLTKVGLASEVRHGDGSSVLVFVKVASNDYLASQIYRERLQDWLFGVRTTAPEKDIGKAFEIEPVTEAERLRLVNLLLTKPKTEGGAGITPSAGQWKNVTSIFPLHDHAFNTIWIKKWSTKYFLDDEDLDRIRDKFGESVAFYFAFLQSYFAFQFAPAAFGVASWLILGHYSWLFAFANSLWSVVFFEWWKKKEIDLAVQWGVRNVSRIQHARTKFQWDHEAPDPITGELVKHYSPTKRLQTQLLQVPFALACLLVLGALYVFCFSIEIFLTQIYNGPFKSYLTFTPTIILSGILPVLSALLTKFAEVLTERENYQTSDAHTASLIRKIFILNFITSYTPLFLSAFVYMPFGNLMMPYLDVFKTTAHRFYNDKSVTAQEFHINQDRLKGQMIYFAVTAQVVNVALEFVVPYLKQIVFKKVEKVQAKRSASQDESHIQDPPEERKFLQRVRDEAKLGVYDVAVDYREMIVQFGYLSLFSSIWPLTPLSFLINNWIELRSDAMKIAMSCQRPIPWRSDSIGPWLSSLGFLSWAGSLVSAALVFLFSGEDGGPNGDPSNVNVVGLLVAILVSEHVYLGIQFIVRYTLNQMDSPGLQKEKKERFAMRKQLLEETFGPDAMEAAVPPTSRTGEKITLAALEEEARKLSTTGGNSPEQIFWLRQQGMDETLAIGRKLITSAKPQEKWDAMKATFETVEEAVVDELLSSILSLTD